MTIRVWDGAPVTPGKCDLLIVGGGAAGLALAHALADTGKRIIVAEAGTEDWEPASQEIYAGKAAGLPIDLAAARLRMLGGSTNHWGGRSHPFDVASFAPRPWLGLPGWPISYADFAAYLAPAMALLEIPAGNFVAAHWRPEGDPVWPFDKTKFIERCWRFSPPTLMQERVGGILRAKANLEVLLDCNLVGLHRDGQGQRVARCTLSTLSGKRQSLEAGMVVLATGGIENARLLLAANEGGFGNDYDQVGRYFAGHPVYEPLAIQLLDGVAKPKFFSRFDQSGAAVEGMVSLAASAQERRETTAVDGAFYPGAGQFGSVGIKALRRIWRSVKRAEWPEELGRDLAIVAGDLDATGEELLRRANLAKTPDRLTVSVLVEQVPNPESRVVLNAERDALGMRRATVDWRLSEVDRHSIQTFANLLAHEIGRLNVGRAQLAEFILDSTVPMPRHGNSAHHIGTTRMSASPRTGVVDINCRVFDVPNLFIAGSSVFPVGDRVHPTLNLVALTLRLADHLKALWRPPEYLSNPTEHRQTPPAATVRG